MQTERVYHVTTFVPPAFVDAVIEAICKVAPLAYGPYHKAAWWSAVGVEQFEPVEGAAPTVGEVGRTERVETVRLEFVIPADRDLLDRILADGVFAAHPWETPAIIISESLVAYRKQASES